MSRIAGTTRGFTNEPTSMYGSPALTSASTSRSRASSGITACRLRICIPSRSETSQILTSRNAPDMST